MKKNSIAVFRQKGFTMTIDINLIETKFLDLTFSLATCKFFPFKKPYNVPLYINVKLNHLSTIIKGLPKVISKRLSELSCNKYNFDKAKLLYEKSLQESGYKTSTPNAETEVKTNKNRSRSIVWFNPPFSQNVKTNIGKIFLKLIIKIFPSHHRLNIIFNLNTTRLRNSCMSNMSSFIKQTNHNILFWSPNSKERS